MAKNNFIPLVGGGTQMPASAEAVAADILRLDVAVSDLAEDVGTVENWDAGDIPYDSSENYNDGTVGGSLNDLKSAMGDLDELETFSNTDLVSAINELYEMLGGKVLSSISAVFTQGQNVIYASDSLNSLKQYLVVTATYNDSSSEVLASTAYSLSGTLVEGTTSTITVTYRAKTDAFDVVVTDMRSDRVLLWSDEFDTLDTDTWGYELGYIRNGEKQYYTSDSKNCYVSDSVLHLVALKDNPANDFEWSSASIDSSYNYPNGHGFFYGNGLIEAKIRIPLTSSGVWPAWWSVGAIKAATCASGTYVRNGMAWPNATEIDMLDYIGGDAVSGSIKPGVIYQNNPYSVSAATIKGSNGYSLSDGEWHILGMEYTATALKFYQDRTLVAELDITGVDNLAGNFAYPIKFNLAMGATSGEIPSELTRAEFLVDWVRYYAPAGTAAADVVDLTASLSSCPSALNKNKEVPIYPVYSGVSRNLFLSWVSSDASVATVACGYLKTKANGSTTLSAYDDDGNLVATKSISVADNNVVSVTDFDVVTDISALQPGETKTVSLHVYPTYATNTTAVLSSSSQYVSCSGNQITNNNNTGASVTAQVTITTADGGHSVTQNVVLMTAKSYEPTDQTNILNNYTLNSFSFDSATPHTWFWTDEKNNGSTLGGISLNNNLTATSNGLYTSNTPMGSFADGKRVSESYSGDLTMFVVLEVDDTIGSWAGTICSLFSSQGPGFNSSTKLVTSNATSTVTVSDMTGKYVILCVKGSYSSVQTSWRWGAAVNNDSPVWTDTSQGSYWDVGGPSDANLKRGTKYGIGNGYNQIAKFVYYKQILAYSSIKSDSDCASIMSELYAIHSS